MKTANKRIIRIILCEGDTDRDLLGYYITRVTNWRYQNKLDEPPFKLDKDSKSYIAWYKYAQENNDEQENILAIWPVGGNDFTHAVKKISRALILGSGVQKLIIITDHDDKLAESERRDEIYSELMKNLGADASKIDDNISGWSTFSFTGRLMPSTISVYYLLVPLEENGALETFMMSALCENDENKAALITEAKSFVQKISSKITSYLTGRREKIKAELGITISVLSPDKVFTTMNELINSVQWENCDDTHKQFKILREI